MSHASPRPSHGVRRGRAGCARRSCPGSRERRRRPRLRTRRSGQCGSPSRCSRWGRRGGAGGGRGVAVSPRRRRRGDWRQRPGPLRRCPPGRRSVGARAQRTRASAVVTFPVCRSRRRRCCSSRRSSRVRDRPGRAGGRRRRRVVPAAGGVNRMAGWDVVGRAGHSVSEEEVPRAGRRRVPPFRR